MSKVVTIREFMLKPETDVEEFEKFVKEETPKFVWEEGVSHRFVKHEQGKASGPYLFIVETDEQTHNLPQEERDKITAEISKANPINAKIVAQMEAYTIDWLGEFEVNTYVPVG